MPQSLKIHFFAQCVHEQGTYFRFHNLAKAIFSQGHAITIHGLDFSSSASRRSETREGVSYEIINSFPGARFFNPAINPINVMRCGFLPRFKGDVAHLFQPFPAAYIGWKRSIATLKAYDWDDLWEGGFWRFAPRSLRNIYERGVVGRLEKRLPKISNLTTTCSDYLEKMARNRGAIHAAVVPNGVILGDGPSKEEARQALGLKQDAFYVGFMGRTCDELEWCFDAMSASLSIRRDLRLALCGVSWESLCGLSEDLLDRIDFLGSLPYSEARKFSYAIDLGLLPLEKNPFNESRFPIKFAEYLGAGLPVLCSPVGECAKFSRYFLNGVISGGETREEWIKVFIHSVKNGPFALPKPDKKNVSEILDWNKIASDLLSAYKDGIESNLKKKLS